MQILGVLAATGTVPLINVKDYGATGNGTTDDTAAITAAFTAAGSSDVIIYFPKGTYLDSAQRNFDSSSNAKIVGAGGNIIGLEFRGHTTTEWRYTGTAATFVSAKHSVGFTLQGMAVTYSSASFAGDLFDLTDSRTVAWDDFYVGGIPYTGPITARSGVMLDAVAWARFANGTFARCLNGVWGINAASGYSNAINFDSVTFSQSPCSIRNPGEVWTFTGCVWEPTTANKTCPIILDASPANMLCQNLSFFGCGFWDITASGGGPWFQMSQIVKGITVNGSRIDAESADGPFFDLTEGSTGIEFHGNTILTGENPSQPLIRVSGAGGLTGSSASGHFGFWFDNSESSVTTVRTKPQPQSLTAYTLGIGDAGKTLYCSNTSGPTTITIPPLSSVKWTGGTVIRIMSAVNQTVTIAAGAGVTIADPYSRGTVPQKGIVELVNYGSDRFLSDSNVWTIR